MNKTKLIKVIGRTSAIFLFAGFAITASAANNNENYYGNQNWHQNQSHNYEYGGYMNYNNSYSAHLSGGQEVPPVGSNMSGHSEVWFQNNTGNTLNYSISATGTNVTGAHLHCGAQSQNGPIVVSLFENHNGQNVNGEFARGTISNSNIASTGVDCKNVIGYSISNTSDLAKAIREGKIYANIHTKEFPNGAARGQLASSTNYDPNHHNGYVDNHSYNYGNKDDNNSYDDDCEKNDDSYPNNNWYRNNHTNYGSTTSHEWRYDSDQKYDGNESNVSYENEDEDEWDHRSNNWRDDGDDEWDNDWRNDDNDDDHYAYNDRNNRNGWNNNWRSSHNQNR